MSKLNVKISHTYIKTNYEKLFSNTAIYKSRIAYDKTNYVSK